ncbi:MAG: exodeoxyribonuclease VII small subunit [Chloroflexi bacterium]|nr:exodeoxyribonuclease VII small subunit [Chloroflexota bacterium]
MPDGVSEPNAGDADESFEALFMRLEAITAQLEAGDLPLERSVELYAEGMRIAERCQRMLADASQRVERLREAYDEAQSSLL